MVSSRHWLAMVCASMAIVAPGPAQAAPQAVEQGFVTTTDGVRLYYQKVGRSPRVVIQPGRLFAFADFAWLGEHFTLISYDMRNRGRSDLVTDDAAIGFEQDVDDIEAVRRHFGVERMSLMGYSYLGKIAVLYALEHPARVERIIQFGPVPPEFGIKYRPEYVHTADPVDPEARARLRTLRNEQGYHLTHPREYCIKEWNTVHRPTLVGDPSRVDRVNSSVCEMPNEWPVLQVRHMRLHFEESGMTHKTPIDRVRLLRTPVLTVHGTHDRNAPFGAGRDWAYLLPNARLLAVEGAAHQAFAEAREDVMPAVLDFLRGGWPAGAIEVAENPRR
jgi:proline iminopeptidase